MSFQSLHPKSRNNAVPELPVENQPGMERLSLFAGPSYGKLPSKKKRRAAALVQNGHAKRMASAFTFSSHCLAPHGRQLDVHSRPPVRYRRLWHCKAAQEAPILAEHKTTTEGYVYLNTAISGGVIVKKAIATLVSAMGTPPLAGS